MTSGMGSPEQIVRHDRLRECGRDGGEEKSLACADVIDKSPTNHDSAKITHFSYSGRVA